MARIAVIGTGFAGLSSAAYLSAAGHHVDVFEKNATAGGRARQFTTDNGYVFDMGPSWYWMPGVFERFFGDFGYRVPDLYQLKLLDPSFEMVFETGKLKIPAGYDELRNLFDSVEPGSANRLDRFMKEARFKYEAGMEKLAYKPGLSWTEFADRDLLKGLFRLQVFSSFSKHVRKYFSHPWLISLMEFPVLFLGAMPSETPALYSLMNYAGLKLGTWYPMGGFGKLIEAMTEVTSRQGAHFHFNAPVEQIIVENGIASGIVVNGERLSYDAVIAAADYQHVESQLLPTAYRNYPASYWDKKTMAPSCLIYFIGLNRKTNLPHHTLFFEEDLWQHSLDIYKKPSWPSRPLFYCCCPSRTDQSVAPDGHEKLFLLMPIAPGLDDDDQTREKYYKIMMRRLQDYTGQDLQEYIDYKRSYCIRDFIEDYNAFKGNAYGLANTLLQTAILKPRVRNRKVPNLFYAGQLTVPGPGVPPALVSGKIAATQLQKYLNTVIHETIV